MDAVSREYLPPPLQPVHERSGHTGQQPGGSEESLWGDRWSPQREMRRGYATMRLFQRVGPGFDGKSMKTREMIKPTNGIRTIQTHPPERSVS